MTQPQQVGPDSLIVSLGDGVGVARLDVTRDADNWRVTERWTSRDLKPSFNDFVHHEGNIYGFDQNVFACIDAQTGKRRWKQGRYGFGQVVLLAQLGQLIVAAEDGSLVLVNASPDAHVELGRIAALDGKTWNHPIVANDCIFARNGASAVGLELCA